MLLRAILAKAKDHFFWEKSNNLLSFPLLNDDRDMSLHTFLNCYSSNNPEDVKYKFNLLDGLREVLNSFDSNKDNIEEVLKGIIEDYKKKITKKKIQNHGTSFLLYMMECSNSAAMETSIFIQISMSCF